MARDGKCQIIHSVINVTDLSDNPGETIPAGHGKDSQERKPAMIRSAHAYVMERHCPEADWPEEHRPEEHWHAAADEVARPEYRHAEPSPFLDDLAERIATICVPPCTCAASAGEGRPALALFTEDGHMRPFADIESEIIRVAVDRYDGRISEIARRLQIGRSTVYRKIEEFGIRPDRTAAGA